MSLLVNANGTVKTYVIADDRAKKIVEAFDYVGQACKRRNELEKADANLSIHNITHSKCPEWLRDLIRADGEYCNRRAVLLDEEAMALRRKAAELVVRAEEYEGRAAEWRNLQATASTPNGTGI